MLGRNTVTGVVLSSMLFAALRTGATKLQFRTQVSADIISVIQALVLLLVAAEQIVRWLYRVREANVVSQAPEDGATPVTPSAATGGAV